MCLNQITFDRFFTQQVTNDLFSSANFNENKFKEKKSSNINFKGDKENQHNISTDNLKEDCPLCLVSIEKNELNDHLKTCLSSQNFDNDF